MLDNVLDHIDQTLDERVSRLFEFLRIHSISTDTEYAEPCKTAANWIARQLREIGVNASVERTNSHPIVLGKTDGLGPHLLFYGHYDVQPVDPIDLWKTAPFVPRLVGNGQSKAIVARGAADDKGQLLTFFEALRAWKEVNHELPLQLTFLIEGDEENGSLGLADFVERHAKYLKSKLALVCDTARYDEDTPAITTSLRGLLKEQITIQTASRDLHSGHYGGLAPNATMLLCNVLAELKDQSGFIQIPGFYDDISKIPAEMAQSWKDLCFDVEEFLGDVGISEESALKLDDPLSRLWTIPTCEINGLHSGYGGEGFKTIIPCNATAKVSFRLVPGQDPKKIKSAFRDFIRARLPDFATVDFKNFGASAACRMDVTAPDFRAAADALSDEWPKQAAFVGSGGSIPVAMHFQRILGLDSLLVGYSLKSDRIHSPNEKYDLKSFHKGIRSWVRILSRLKELN